VAGWPTHVAKSSLICPHGAVVEKKRKIIEGNEGKKGERWLAGHKSLAERPLLASTQLSLSFFTTSCSSHAHSTDQKHQKQSKFPSSFSKVLFISFVKFLDFMICNDVINKYAVGKE
jgi:hypothetical protein